MRFSLLKSDTSRLFLISFLILFFELVCIRWLSSYVLYLGYFTNFVLLGSLLGIGAGALLAHKSYKLGKWLPAVLFVFVVGSLFAGAQVNPDFADIIYFTNNIAVIQLPPHILLPIIFIGYLPYTAFNEQPAYDNVLIVGVGGGNDVAVALKEGVQHIDAVEIDPRIIGLGKNYHPEHPYDDPRVTVYIDDARSFLEETDAKYNAIIFALPDPLVLTTISGSIRLESYLFTIESFQNIKEHLKPDGIFVLYNYYRNEWLIDKIVSMLSEVFDAPPVAYRYSDPKLKYFATIFAGPKSRELNLTPAGLIQSSTHYIPATDNWPFLYMKEPSLPRLYGGILFLILFFSFLYVWTLSPKGAVNRHGLPFFFMGCAFTLLETKSIVNFLLLFGSTWLVNSLVFFAILSVVLIANWLATRYKFSQMKILYTFLFAALGFNSLVPLKTLLCDNLIIRYILATAFLFSPIFLPILFTALCFAILKRRMSHLERICRARWLVEPPNIWLFTLATEI